MYNTTNHHDFYDISLITRHWVEIQSERLETIRRSLHFPLRLPSTALGSAGLLTTPLIFEGCPNSPALSNPLFPPQEGIPVVVIRDFDLLVCVISIIINIFNLYARRTLIFSDKGYELGIPTLETSSLFPQLLYGLTLPS
jgi:hypothetical protein